MSSGLITTVDITGKYNNHGTTIIDLDDLALVWRKPWYMSFDKYVTSKNDGKSIRLHREIRNAPKGMVIDHINRDPSDNRKENLRCVTEVENALNSERCDNASGIWYHRQVGYWCVRVRHKSYGLFITKQEALDYARRTKAGEVLPKHYIKPQRQDVDTHCSRGHEYSLTCAYVTRGRKDCRVCAIKRAKDYIQTRKDNTHD